MLLVLVLLSIGLTTLGLLIVLALALIRHLSTLTASLERLRQDIAPLVQEVTEGSSAMDSRARKLAERR